MEYTYPANRMRDGAPRTVTAYRTKTPGLIVTHGFDYANQPTSKLWLIVHEPSGFSLSKTLDSRKQAKAIAGALGGMFAWSQTSLDDAPKAIEAAGFRKWYLNTVQ